MARTWQWPIPVPPGIEIWADGVFIFDTEGNYQSPYAGGDPTKPRKVGRGKGKGLPCVRVFRSPWWVSAVGDDTSGAEPVCWIRLENGRTRPHWATATELTSRAGIANLANRGFPITLGNVVQFSELVDAWKGSSAESGSSARVSARLGTLTFEEPDGSVTTGYLSPRKWYGPGEVQHTGHAPQVLRALRSKGTIADWIALADAHTASPIARWLLMSSFAPPVLRALGVRTFFLHHWGGTGSGKSALAKLAASVWGDPRSFALTFNATQRGLFEAFTDFDGLLCVVNELQIASYREHMAQIIYSTTEEGARLRSGQQGGAERRETNFRLIARTNGEQPILTDADQSTGVANRTLELKADVLTSAEASALHRALENSGAPYGVAGEHWVDWCLGEGAGAVLATHEGLRTPVLETLRACTPHAVDAPHVGMLHALTTVDVLASELLYQGARGAHVKDALARLRVVAPLVLPVREGAAQRYLRLVLDALSGQRDSYDWANVEHRDALTGATNPQVGAVVNPTETEAVWLTPSALSKLCRLPEIRVSKTQVLTAWHESGLLASPVPTKRRLGSRRLRVFPLLRS